MRILWFRQFTFKERKVKKVIKDHEEIVTGIEFFNKPSHENFDANKFDKINKIKFEDLANDIQEENIELNEEEEFNINETEDIFGGGKLINLICFI